MGSGVARQGLIIGLLAAVLALPAQIAVAQITVAQNACRPDTLEMRWPGGKARFGVEIAKTEAEQARGLMHRQSMPASAGMLFVFPEPKHAAFWMKNTLIPLDMLFIDASGRVMYIHPNARPNDETVIDGGEGIQYVLEINGGLSKRLAIPAGAEIRHPSIRQSAALWPCSDE